MEELKALYAGKPLPTITVKAEFSAEGMIDALEMVNSGVELNTKMEQTEAGAITYVDIEAAAKYTKENMDKRFGPTWQCIMGEGMSFDVNYQEKNLFFGVAVGNLAILLFKT
jgi:dynein light chain 4